MLRPLSSGRPFSFTETVLLAQHSCMHGSANRFFWEARGVPECLACTGVCKVLIRH